ncbi:hypothetical protein MFLAVUS_007026 [Mucor flavus]|uniref:Reverse transcriptase n=1 Tax=Mucor flavus TaxID=439312 RepID=A0ABP9Z359_9FUNG
MGYDKTSRSERSKILFPRTSLLTIAFEPFLRRVLHGRSFTGFILPKSKSTPPTVTQNFKPLAYVDDIAGFLSSPSDLHILKQHLAMYSAASNAHINFYISEAFALLENCSIYDPTWCATLIQTITRNPLEEKLLLAIVYYYLNYGKSLE